MPQHCTGAYHTVWGYLVLILFILALHLHLVWMCVVVDACLVASAVRQVSLGRKAGVCLGSDGFRENATQNPRH